MTNTETKVQHEIKNLEIKTTKTNKQYAVFTLEDGNEKKTCVMWDKDYERLKDKLRNGNVIAGIVWSYNKEYNNYNVTDIEELVSECKDGLSREEAVVIFSEVILPAMIAAKIDISKFLSENTEEILTFPAASYHHHAYRGGLMQHTLEVIRTAEVLCDFYRISGDRKINILAACALHDLFKVKEYTYDGICASSIKDFRIQETSHTLAMYAEVKSQNQVVANLIGTHHGRVEWGALREADEMDELIVHYSDMLSSRGGALTVKDL